MKSILEPAAGSSWNWDSFPKLVINDDKGLILLATELTDAKDYPTFAGFVIHPGVNTVPGIGHYSVSWNRTAFRDYRGRVILQND